MNKMKLTILGCGTYVPESNKATSSYLIETKDKKILFDIGRGSLNNLTKYGVSYADLDMIAISHVHADHMNDICTLLLLSIFEPKETKKRNKPLLIIGPEGINRSISLIKEAFGMDEKSKWIEIKSMKDNEEFKYKDLILKSYSTEHYGMNSLAFRLISGEKIIGYSGDGKDCSGIRKSIKGSNLAIIESTNSITTNNESHLNGLQAGIIAQEEKAKKLLLTHINPSNTDAKKDAQANFSGDITIAKDLMEIKI